MFYFSFLILDRSIKTTRVSFNEQLEIVILFFHAFSYYYSLGCWNVDDEK